MPIFDPSQPLNGEVILANPTNDAHWRHAGVTTNSSFTVKGLTCSVDHQ